MILSSTMRLLAGYAYFRGQLCFLLCDLLWQKIPVCVVSVVCG